MHPEAPVAPHDCVFSRIVALIVPVKNESMPYIIPGPETFRGFAPALLIEWYMSPSSGSVHAVQRRTFSVSLTGEGSGRLMSMQTGSTRGHHLANYHCWHIGADLNCHHKHITPCPNCPAICHHATRRAIQYGEDGGQQETAPVTKPPGQHCRQDSLPGHLLSSLLEDTQWTLNVSYSSQCPVWLTGVYCVYDIFLLREGDIYGGSICSKPKGCLK